MALVKVYQSDVTGKAVEHPEHVTITIGGIARVIDVERDAIETELASISVADAFRSGRVVETKPARRTTRRRATSPMAATIRSWARDNGIEVAKSGAIPKDVEAKYYAAQSAAKENKAEGESQSDAQSEEQREA